MLFKKTEGFLSDASIYVSYEGLYCFISPRSDSIKCLDQIVSFIEKLMSINPNNIKYITLMMYYPLIRYVKKQNESEILLYDGPISKDKDIVKSLQKNLFTFLEWK